MIMQDFLNKKILIGVSGGIAAYKVAFLVRELIRLGAKVKVVMTEHAKEFISPLTFQTLSQEEVVVGNGPGPTPMEHIELSRWADCIVVAPATANILAKFAHGLADDLLSTLFLVATVPTLLCPAMNKNMWQHPATQNNCKILAQRGAIFVGPGVGEQACQDVGLGRLEEISEIIEALRLYHVYQLLKDKTILITAGPTREEIDSVRYLSNYSSGKMGYALARATQMAGAKVMLVSGPTVLERPSHMAFLPVKTASEMYHAVMDNLTEETIFIGAAAVSDYALEKPFPNKLNKKEHPTLPCTFIKNKDILSSVAETGKARYTIGFAAQTDDVITYAKQKMAAKKVDMMIANQVGEGIGFEQEGNQVTILTKSDSLSLPYTHKTRLAADIISFLALQLQPIFQNMES